MLFFFLAPCFNALGLEGDGEELNTMPLCLPPQPLSQAGGGGQGKLLGLGTGTTVPGNGGLIYLDSCVFCLWLWHRMTLLL